MSTLCRGETFSGLPLHTDTEEMVTAWAVAPGPLNRTLAAGTSELPKYPVSDAEKAKAADANTNQNPGKRPLTPELAAAAKRLRIQMDSRAKLGVDTEMLPEIKLPDFMKGTSAATSSGPTALPSSPGPTVLPPGPTPQPPPTSTPSSTRAPTEQGSSRVGRKRKVPPGIRLAGSIA